MIDASPYTDARICGAHAFHDPRLGNCSDAKAWVLGGTAYGNTVEFRDVDSTGAGGAGGAGGAAGAAGAGGSDSGSVGFRYSYLRRERPHFILSAGTPTHLSTGVAYVDSSTKGRDACFTLVQPIATR
jgi:hypothetical protein